MPDTKKIRVAVIDDMPEAIKELTEYLTLIPDVEICGTATKYNQAKELLLREQPDLVFLDVELPCKDRFRLLNETRLKGCFYTTYDKYMPEALHESAFDYIVKPVEAKKVKTAIERFKKQQRKQGIPEVRPLFFGMPGTPEIIALPASKGLCFVDVKRIVLFRSVCKNSWEAMLTDSGTLRLGKNTNAGKILELLTDKRFVQISQSCIVNLIYLNTVEFKSRDCLLLPPFDHLKLKISRIYLTKLREDYQHL